MVLTTMLGRGIIMLLSGPPGVGKTLTAESCKLAIHSDYISPNYVIF
jgi:ATP-dependent Lon protease